MSIAGWVRAGAVLAVLLAAIAVWQWGPLADVVEPANLAEWGSVLREQWWGYVAVMGVYVVGGVLIVPQSALVVASVVMYGPAIGFVVALAGSLLNGAVLFGIGNALGGRRLRSIAGDGGRIEAVSRMLGRRGILSMVVIRQIPIAPYSIVNLAAGASHIRFSDYMIGTAIGMLPWTLAITLVSEQFFRALRAPTWGGAVAAGVVLLLFIGAGWLVRRWVSAWWRRRDRDPLSDPG